MAKSIWTKGKKSPKHFNGFYKKDGEGGRYFQLKPTAGGRSVEFNSPQAAKKAGWVMK